MEPDGYYEKYFDAKLESIAVRLDSMDKALQVRNSTDKDRFVTDSSFRSMVDEIKKANVDVATRVGILETKVAVYLTIAGIIFTAVQVVLKFYP